MSEKRKISGMHNWWLWSISLTLWMIYWRLVDISHWLQTMAEKGQ